MQRYARYILGAFLLTTLLPQLAAADVYGNGSYGASQYNSNAVATGTLPATGALALGLAAIVAISVGVGLIVWTRNRRRRAHNNLASRQ